MKSRGGGFRSGAASPRRDRYIVLVFLLWSFTVLVVDPGNVLVLNGVTCVAACAAMMFLTRHAALGNLILTVFVLVLFVFSLFVVFVLNVFDEVLVEPQFDFSVFTFPYLKTTFAVNTLALAVGVLVLSFTPKIYQRTTMLEQAERSDGKLVHGREGLSQGLWLSVNWCLILGVFWLLPNVHDFSYPENHFQPGNIHSTIRVLLVLMPFSAFLFFLTKSRWLTTSASLPMRLTFYAAIYFIALSGGSRGAVTGLLFATLAIDLVLSRDKIGTKSLWVVVDGLYACFAIVNWPSMRVEIADLGWWSAFVSSFDRYLDILQVRSFDAGGIFLSDFPMIGQSLFHFLYVISLVDSGDNYGFQTFTNLIPQQLPEVLDGILWDRPIADSWVIGDYYAGSGGFYSVGNAYWNQGWVVAVAFTAVLAWVLAWIEGCFKNKSPEYLIAYFTFLYLIPVNMYYGIQGLVRGIEYGLIAFLIVKAFVNRERQEAQLNSLRRSPA